MIFPFIITSYIGFASGCLLIFTYRYYFVFPSGLFSPFFSTSLKCCFLYYELSCSRMRFSSGKSDLHCTTCAVGYNDFHNLMGVVGSALALSAVPPALPSPGGQSDLIVQLGSLFINVNERGQSPLVNSVLTGVRTSKQYC